MDTTIPCGKCNPMVKTVFVQRFNALFNDVEDYCGAVNWF